VSDDEQVWEQIVKSVTEPPKPPSKVANAAASIVAIGAASAILAVMGALVYWVWKLVLG
jgi:hypothetical protein